ncbi:hypothetical protein H6P81_012804 [Aristolochia fimbriata]|uniref:Uncharacterized protein n=1 Tax=Aristolochia fimbriata TaxID=158543 RepID=A0AAV7EE43_ARIFI|nr:hypothetical protein H6P81_012804 [Aristolochia fimbriata]
MDTPSAYDGQSKCAHHQSSPVVDLRKMRRFAGGGRRSLVEDLPYRESPSGASTATRNVVIVMDAMKEFSREPLEWALAHVIRPGYVVTLLGVMPWLNLPLTVKTWLDIWTLNFEDLRAIKEWEAKGDTKYQKLRGIIQLCEKFGVKLQMKVAMGYPLRLVVLEQTMNLHATWAVFDRHHRKNRAFFAKRMPCNIVMMNNRGEVDMIKVRPMICRSDACTPSGSPATSVPAVHKVDISEELMQILHGNEETEKSGSKQ